ncbi:MAG: GNAT family N-acetyltransferase [Proteobacteria bacterium]|nr:GNAT family N-acetyltransferase [Pseudomonadota bacterium]MDA1058035.1 GNAT family N-acetyltransferase [Pseudomonadota bacterium]
MLSADGRYEIRVTRDPADIEAAQRLRYHVFYDEMSADPSPEMRESGRDFDRFDTICDHLLVIDRERPVGQQIVGTYRMLLRADAEAHGGYYSSSEYDIADFVAGFGGRNAAEIGRSCVHADYRNQRIVELLWRGLAHYYRDNNVERIFGCASFPGTDPEALALPLSYLYHFHLAPPDLRVRALSALHVPMNRIDKEELNPRSAIRQVPALIRAYLRLGGVCGDGAVIDHQFGTTDVFMVLAMENLPDKYHDYFERDTPA